MPAIAKGKTREQLKSARMIRQLRDDESIPTSAPRRYKSSKGYIRLRWRLPDGNYVEAYEHRIIAGRPKGHVHHKNRVTGDNRPDNLVALASQDHVALHATERHKFSRSEAARLYTSGHSTVDIAARFGVNHGTVYRALDKLGVPFRQASDYWKKDIDLVRIRELHGAGWSTYRIADALGVSQQNIQIRVRWLGLVPHRQYGGRKRKCA